MNFSLGYWRFTASINISLSWCLYGFSNCHPGLSSELTQVNLPDSTQRWTNHFRIFPTHWMIHLLPIIHHRALRYTLWIWNPQIKAYYTISVCSSSSKKEEELCQIYPWRLMYIYMILDLLYIWCSLIIMNVGPLALQRWGTKEISLFFVLTLL